MAGSARLQTVGEMRYALDFSGEGAALWRHSPAGGWEELARDALQLGAVSATMAKLRKAARLPDGQEIAVEVWLPEEQLIIKPINTGGVPPVPAMIEHAFASASPDGLAGVVLDASPRASGPMHIYAGVTRAVIEETIAFLAPHGFTVTAFTRPDEPAGLDHIPVILPPPAPPKRRGLLVPMGAAAAAALVAGGVWLGGVLPGSAPAPEEQRIAAVTEVRQVTVAPDLTPALSRAVSLTDRPLAPAQPARPDVTAAPTGSGFTPPERPGQPVTAQSEVVAGLRSVAPGEVPGVGGAGDQPVMPARQAGALTTPEVPVGAFGLVQTASPDLAAAPEAVETALTVEPRALPQSPARADVARLDTLTTAPDLPDLTGLLALAAAVAPEIGAVPAPLTALTETSSAVAVAALASAQISDPGQLTPPGDALPLPLIGPAAPTPGGVAVFNTRPDPLPPMRPRPNPVEPAVAEGPEEELPADPLETAEQDADETRPARAETPAAVVVITTRPDILPPLRPGAEPTPVETAEAALPADAQEIPATEESAVTVVAALPEVIPQRRPSAGAQEDEGATPQANSAEPDVRVIASRPDILPPLRPRAAAPAPQPEAETEPAEAPDLIAALIEDAGDLDLSPSARAITRQAPPPRRPRAIEEAEAERKARLAALQPTERALKLSSAPRKRPAGLVAPTVASVPRADPAPAATTARAPDPAPSTRRAPQLPTSASVARAATIDNALPLRQLALIGVYGRSGNRHALLRLPSGRYMKVEPGDKVDGFEVTAISADAIRLRKRGRDTLLVIPD